MNESQRNRPRVGSAQPAWAERLADAQARANARRIDHADATITTWVRTLMRERPVRARRGRGAPRAG
jgi:hypothetical protein